MTVYDPTITPFERVRWTIAHEIGHIMLGHLTDFECTALNRGGSTRESYKVLEDEANFFAAELLEPMTILKEIGALEQKEIIHACKVSKRAATNRSIDLDRWGKSTIACEADSALKKWFALYLSRVAICAQSGKIEKHLIIEKPGVVYVASGKQHLYLETDERSRFLSCPQCGNSNFSKDANFCKICGCYLYDICGDIPDYPHGYQDRDGEWVYTTEINPGDARYCEHCGQETFLTRRGFIMKWEEVVKAHGEVAAGNDPTEKPVRAGMSNGNGESPPPLVDDEQPPFLDDEVPF